MFSFLYIGKGNKNSYGIEAQQYILKGLRFLLQSVNHKVVYSLELLTTLNDLPFIIGINIYLTKCILGEANARR